KFDAIRVLFMLPISKAINNYLEKHCTPVLHTYKTEVQIILNDLLLSFYVSVHFCLLLHFLWIFLFLLECILIFTYCHKGSHSCFLLISVKSAYILLFL